LQHPGAREYEADTDMCTPRRLPATHLALYLGLALLLTQLHGEWVNFGPNSGKRAERHEQIIRGEGEAPWVYRVVVPWTAELTGRVIEKAGLPKQRAVEYGYLIWRFVFTFGLFLLFHRYLGHWVPPPFPLLGTVLLAGLHGPAYAHYWFQPASSLDLLLWVVAAVLTMERRWVWLFPLILLGGLNRETSVFIVLIHGALLWGREPLRPVLLRTVGLAACWALPFMGVRLLSDATGWAHGSNPVGMLVANLTHPGWLLYALCFWSVLWALPFLRWRRLPRNLKALLLVLVPYLVLQLLFGRIREVRLLLPLALALVPVGLLALQEQLRERR
jgi:hypothetical protein